jgi:hypothetical protein
MDRIGKSVQFAARKPGKPVDLIIHSRLSVNLRGFASGSGKVEGTIMGWLA